MSEPNYMWGNVFDKPAESQAEIAALRAENERLRDMFALVARKRYVLEGEYQALLARVAELEAENKALNEAVDNARHDSWGQAGVIEKLEARVAELHELGSSMAAAIHSEWRTGMGPVRLAAEAWDRPALAGKEGE